MLSLRLRPPSRRMVRLGHSMCLAGAVFLCIAVIADRGFTAIRPVALRCNGLSEDVGVCRDSLELSWQIEGNGFQSAYRVVLASTAELATQGKGDLLDTGWLASRTSHAVVRAPSRMPVVWWSVQLRDETGVESSLAAPQRIVFAPRGSEWRAFWIVDPRVALRDSAVPNSHSFFRREFRVHGEIESAFCFVTADDYYKLYLNGRYVGQGPAPAYLDSYYFNTYDVTDLLRPGQDNCIAVHAYYQGLVNRVWVSGDGLSGLILQLEIHYRDGRVDTVVTDGRWRVLRSEAYRGEPTGYRTQFLENVDGRKLPAGWQQPGFDDSDWPNAVALGRPPLRERKLVPQPTPSLELHRAVPRRIQMLGPGHYLVDFGRELVGTLGLRVSGPAGHKIEIRHAEELNPDGTARYKLRANCTYREFYKLAGVAEEYFEFYDYKGFRFVEVLNFPSELDTSTVWAVERHYPFDPNACRFQTSDTLLQKIWDLCVYSIRQGSQEVYVDCPTREKGQYLGDSYVEGLSHFYGAGVLLLQKKAIENFAQSARIVPTLLCVAPCSYRQEIADYSLEWPLFLEEYFWLSGDRRFLRRMIPVLKGLLAAFSRYENELGLLQAVPMNNLVDWPPNLRDDYDIEHAKDGVNTVLNSFYIGALEAAARLARQLGEAEDAEKWEHAALERAERMNQLLRGPHTRLYVDAVGSEHSSLHANVLPLYFGFCPQESVEPIVRLIERKRFACGVYFAAFVLRALYRAGYPELAFRLLTSRDRNSWANMLRCGATTTLEAWDPDLKWNTSWCHAWATAPVFVIAEELMGLKPAEPGWTRLRIAPQVPRGLESATLTLTLPTGKTSLSFENRQRAVVFDVLVPGNVGADFLADSRRWEIVAVDRHPTAGVNRVELGPGRHRIEARWRGGTAHE